MQHPVAPCTVFPKYEIYLEQILLFIVVGIAINDTRKNCVLLNSAQVFLK